jgi:hypothetical protein
MPDYARLTLESPRRTPWNKGKLIGALHYGSKYVWAIRTRLMVEGRTRDLAMLAYNRAEYLTERRAMMNNWADYLYALAGWNVVPLRTNRHCCPRAAGSHRCAAKPVAELLNPLR